MAHGSAQWDKGPVAVSVAECVSHSDCRGNIVFLHDFIQSGDTSACKSGEINQPTNVSIEEENALFSPDPHDSGGQWAT